MDETGSQRFFRILRGILSYLFVIIILIVSLVPIVWVFMSSFKSNTEILNSALSLPTVWSLKNYVTAFEMVPIATFYGTSAVVAVVATLLNVLVLSMSSYVLARFRFKGSRKLKSLFGLALLIPSAALLQPLYLTMKTLGFYLLYFNSQFASDYGAMFAATMVVIIPSIVVFILLQKQVTEGLVSGAVKG